MKAHGFDMRGEFKGERVPTLPSQGSAFGNEGREIYVEDESKRYYSDGSSWVDYSIAETSTTTDSYLETLPLENRLPDNGRFAGTAAGTSVYCNDVSDPFNDGIYFSPYNSGSSAQAGKFIYNNNDYGGSAGAMTQTTIDLLETQTLRNTNRYGVEYRIAEITAGSGTSASYAFSFGTMYLMTTNYGAWHGFGGWTTFGAWLRCTSGSIGFRSAAYSPCTINGVDYSDANFEITTDLNWIFVLGSSHTDRGYSNGHPLFYGTNGDKLQIALPCVLTGKFLGAYWECPIVTNF